MGQYKTKDEAVHGFVRDSFSYIDGEVRDLLGYDPCKDTLYFAVAFDEDYSDDYWSDEPDDDGLVCTGEPMWGTWFFIDEGCLRRRVNRDKRAVSELGFTLICDASDGEVVALGIDGCGYDFYSHHWTPLYDWLGYHWHSYDNDNEN